MDRRSFIAGLIGGLAAAGLGGATMAEAAEPKPVPLPEPAPAREPARPEDEAVTAEMQDGLDKADAEFSQYYYRRPRYYRRYYRPRFYRRPRYYYRPRPYYRRRYYRRW